MLPNLELFSRCNSQLIEAFVIGDETIEVGWINSKFDIATTLGVNN
jgi:hypothetical protein